MRIVNAMMFLGDGHFYSGCVEISNGIITDVNLSDEEHKPAGMQDQICDAEGAYLLPGFIDLHFHGAVGEDVCDGNKEALHRIAAYELSIGVTSICPATMALPLEELKQILHCLYEFSMQQQISGNNETSRKTVDCLKHSNDHQSDKYPDSNGELYVEDEAELIGINMEAPFISPVKKGAQDARHIIPRSSTIFKELQAAAGGLVRFIGIAPEEPSEESVADFITAVGKLADVSIAHTNAGYEHAIEAFRAGANHAVHLYNAMTGMNHREPGCVGAVADSPHVLAELISDGVHVHPAVIRNTFRMLGADRIILISDSMRATGLTDGHYTLGGLDVEVKGKTARLVSDGAIAGSVTNLPDCVRYAISSGIPMEEAVAAATINPAKALHMEDRIGKIAPGFQADLVLWNPDLSLKAVVKKGRVISMMH